MADFQNLVSPPWTYVEEAPFTVFACDFGVASSEHSFDHLADALRWFVRFHIGPIRSRSVTIADSHRQMLVGYSHWGHDEPAWFGTARGFEYFAVIHDPMSVAVWEAQATGNDGRYEVPQDVVP